MAEQLLGMYLSRIVPSVARAARYVKTMFDPSVFAYVSAFTRKTAFLKRTKERHKHKQSLCSFGVKV